MSEAEMSGNHPGNLDNNVERWRRQGDMYSLDVARQMWGRTTAARSHCLSLLLKLGALSQARLLMLSWLLEWLQSLPRHGKPQRAESVALLCCLADICEHNRDEQLLEVFWQGLEKLRPLPVSRQTIPLVGVPILNGAKHLHKLLASLDLPIDTLAIVDQSGGRDDGESQLLRKQLQQIERDGLRGVKSVRVARPFSNVGVAAAWNQVLLGFPQASLTLLVNHDVTFPPGVLAEALSRMDAEQAQYMALFPAERAFSAFLITALAWDTLGCFDERYYPAYYEDRDYSDRLLAHPKVQRIDGSFAHTRMVALNPQQSQTINEDPEFAEANQFSFQLNRLWYLSRRHEHGRGWDSQYQWRHRWLTQWD